jgi:hypothetical protein
MMLTLYVFPGNEFTASIDAGSLQLITYLRLLGDNSPVHVVSTCNHLKVPTRSLPTLVIDGVTYSRVDDILKEFRKQGLSIDELTEVELAEVFAYQSMLADRLKLPLVRLCPNHLLSPLIHPFSLHSSICPSIHSSNPSIHLSI